MKDNCRKGFDCTMQKRPSKSETIFGKLALPAHNCRNVVAFSTRDLPRLEVSKQPKIRSNAMPDQDDGYDPDHVFVALHEKDRWHSR